MLLALFCMIFNLAKLFPFVFTPLRVYNFNMIVWGMIK